jgi:hypothetical protein
LNACNEEFGLNSSAINDEINSCVAINSVVVNEETILKPKIRINRKILTPEKCKAKAHVLTVKLKLAASSLRPSKSP